MWNRTINLAGGPGRSLPADLVNEFTNKEFKGVYVFMLFNRIYNVTCLDT